MMNSSCSSVSSINSSILPSSTSDDDNSTCGHQSKSGIKDSSLSFHLEHMRRAVDTMHYRALEISRRSSNSSCVDSSISSNSSFSTNASSNRSFTQTSTISTESVSELLDAYIRKYSESSVSKHPSRTLYDEERAYIDQSKIETKDDVTEVTMITSSNSTLNDSIHVELTRLAQSLSDQGDVSTDHSSSRSSIPRHKSTNSSQQTSVRTTNSSKSSRCSSRSSNSTLNSTSTSRTSISSANSLRSKGRKLNRRSLSTRSSKKNLRKNANQSNSSQEETTYDEEVSQEALVLIEKSQQSKMRRQQLVLKLFNEVKNGMNNPLISNSEVMAPVFQKKYSPKKLVPMNSFKKETPSPTKKITPLRSRDSLQSWYSPGGGQEDQGLSALSNSLSLLDYNDRTSVISSEAPTASAVNNQDCGVSEKRSPNKTEMEQPKKLEENHLSEVHACSYAPTPIETFNQSSNHKLSSPLPSPLSPPTPQSTASQRSISVPSHISSGLYHSPDAERDVQEWIQHRSRFPAKRKTAGEKISHTISETIEPDQTSTRFSTPHLVANFTQRDNSSKPLPQHAIARHRKEIEVQTELCNIVSKIPDSSVYHDSQCAIAVNIYNAEHRLKKVEVSLDSLKNSQQQHSIHHKDSIDNASQTDNYGLSTFDGTSLEKPFSSTYFPITESVSSRTCSSTQTTPSRSSSCLSANSLHSLERFSREVEGGDTVLIVPKVPRYSPCSEQESFSTHSSSSNVSPSTSLLLKSRHEFASDTLQPLRDLLNKYFS